MSNDAAQLLQIEHSELLTLLSDHPVPDVDVLQPSSKKDAVITEGTKELILIVSIILFSVAFLVSVTTLVVWAVRRWKKNKDGYQEVADESLEQPSGEKTLTEVINTSPSLPQIFDKPKFPLNIAKKTPTNPCQDEELRQLSIGKLEVVANFYTNRNQLQVNIREVQLNNFNESLRENAFVYLVISLQSKGKTYEPPYVESDLRPISSHIYFDKSSVIEITFEDIALIDLKIAIYASDRFSQHLLLNEYTYSLSVGTEVADAEDKCAILPLVLTVTSRSEDNVLQQDEREKGELLFSLCYMPTSGRLTFVALKGKNLRDEREGSLETYLRVSLMVSGKTMKTVQTTNVDKSANPVYNEAFVFHAPLERIKDTEIDVSVCSAEDLNSQQPKISSKLIVGHNSDSNLARKHWEVMLSAARKPVAQWHCMS